jgi:hypothetical protein
MMSKGSYLTDNGGHDGPHLMFDETAKDDAVWGANLTNSPVLSVNYWYISAQSYPQPQFLRTTVRLPSRSRQMVRWNAGTKHVKTQQQTLSPAGPKIEFQKGFTHEIRATRKLY